MSERLLSFVDELRSVGIPVSMVETLDATAALEHTDLSDREHLRATLGATLVKQERHYPAFNRTFDVYYGSGQVALPDGQEGAEPEPHIESEPSDPSSLTDAVIEALLSGDLDRLRSLVGRAVDDHAGMQPGRPVGGRYYAYRVMSRLGADDIHARLLSALLDEAPSEMDRRLADESARRDVALLREEVDREITARLVVDRGVEAVAASRRLPLPEDLDLMHVTQQEIAELERVVGPLARRLASRLSHRRRRARRRGTLDVRRTIRKSLGHGGVLLEPQFKPPHRSKPELVLITDVSGSMATFARFTMQLASAISSQLSKVRVFAFIDGVDEVTEYFSPSTSFAEALHRIGSEADLVRTDGHSDYGRVFAEFEDLYRDAVSAKTSVIITGDARSNYRDPRPVALDGMAARAKAVFWLNPEPRRYWNTGDSVMAKYEASCTSVSHVRSVRQLEHFVEQTVLTPLSNRLSTG